MKIEIYFSIIVYRNLREEFILKTYKIGEIAKLLGISAETIRNYEKKGLIEPYKEDSNYRYFDIIQVNHLFNIQKFQKYGYNLHEIKEIMNESTLKEAEHSLINKEKELLNEAFYLNLKINSVNATINFMMQAQNAKQECFLGERPPLYRLNYQKNHELVIDERVQEEVVKWLKYADLTFMSGSIQLNAMMNLGKDFDFGFCLDKRTAEFLGIYENDIVQYYDSCPAIVFYYEATPKNDIEGISKMILEYANEHQLRIVGESISRVIFARLRDEEEYHISHLVWIPYEKIES